MSVENSNCVEMSEQEKRVQFLLENDEFNSINLLKKKHHDYVIVKYDKEQTMPHNYFRVGYLRSMIIDTKLNEIVALAPSKSIPVDEFVNECTRNQNTIYYEEFVDGVMINVFWDKHNEKWQYATRSNIGADIRFYMRNAPHKTFRMMFEEALVEGGIDLNVLPRDNCYTFVLQHPENRIVTPVEKPRVVLVEGHLVGDCVNDYGVVHIFPHGKKERDIKLRKIIDENNIPIPEAYKYENVKEARDIHASRSTDFACVGVVLKDYETGWRSKIRNPNYEEVKKLRGNIPKLQFLYLVLRHSGSVGKYLRFYKEHSKEFKNYQEQVHNFTHNLYVNYVDCFIKKKAHINTYPNQYKICMSALHKIYLDTMMYEGRHIHKGVVIKYFNTLPPQHQMYLLNYSYRK